MQIEYVQLKFDFAIDIQEEENKDFSYIQDMYENTVSIFRYVGKDKNVIIPNKINQQKVVAIEEEAFQKKGIIDVEFKGKIIYIKKNAFRYNKLTEIYIPKSVKVIEQGAFKGNPIKRVFVRDIKMKEYLEKYKKEIFPLKSELIFLKY